jgi:hypothetical protein
VVVSCSGDATASGEEAVDGVYEVAHLEGLLDELIDVLGEEVLLRGGQLAA